MSAHEVPWASVLITRRSQVQILPPPPSKEPGQRPFRFGGRAFERLVPWLRTTRVQRNCPSGPNPKVTGDPCARTPVGVSASRWRQEVHDNGTDRVLRFVADITERRVGSVE